MLIDSFAPKFDANEVNQVVVKAPREAVYDALWQADLGSPLIKVLMLLRSLPGLVARRRSLPQKRTITLQTLIDSGFGALAEKPPEEIVFGITGRFWRPAGNLSPFVRSDFNQPVPEGFARGIWNFSLIPETENRTTLRTETRVICGDATSRRKFLAYWLLVRPFSGLIRLIMLRKVRKLAERGLASQSPVHVRRSMS